MRGLVNHEKRNLLAITLVYTIVIYFILQNVIVNDISGTASIIFMEAFIIIMAICF
mgnify:CR=1 FL=1